MNSVANCFFRLNMYLVLVRFSVPDKKSPDTNVVRDPGFSVPACFLKQVDKVPCTAVASNFVKILLRVYKNKETIQSQRNKMAAGFSDNNSKTLPHNHVFAPMLRNSDVTEINLCFLFHSPCTDRSISHPCLEKPF